MTPELVTKGDRRNRLPVLARHPKDGWRPADPYQMSERVREGLRALVRVLVPPPPAPQTADIVDRCELYVRRFMAHMHPLAARGMWLCIVLLDWAPRLMFASLRRLRNLDRERASAILNRMAESRHNLVRSILLGVRALVLSAYFDQDEVHRALHYSPVPFIRQRVKLRQRLLRPAPAIAR
jgi:hypothetical protein